MQESITKKKRLKKMKIEAKDLQSALTKAAAELECSVLDVEYEIIQRPSSGFLGLFKKNAIIEAHSKKKAYKQDKRAFKKQNHFKNETYKEEFKNEPKFEKKPEKEENQNFSEKLKEKAKVPSYKITSEPIFDDFHKENFKDEKKAHHKQDFKHHKSPVKERAQAKECIEEIKKDLTELLRAGEFDIKVLEISVWDNDTIYIKLDGEDAALLIGKEAYRYKALSYLLHNWINSKYNLLVRLEIAEFLKNQEQAMQFYLKNIIEKVENTGRAQTKHLDGVLIKIALEQLRAHFPNKYVGICQNGEQRFVVVNDFFKKDE